MASSTRALDFWEKGFHKEQQLGSKEGRFDSSQIQVYFLTFAVESVRMWVRKQFETIIFGEI